MSLLPKYKDDEAAPSFHFERLPFLIRLTRAVGVIAAIFTSGYIASTSAIYLPADRIAPTGHQIQGLASSHAIGSLLVSLPTLLSSISFAYLAAQALRTPKMLYGSELDPRYSIRLFTAATFLVMSTIPFTYCVMRLLNAKIVDNYSYISGSMDSTDALADLITTWRVLNGIRACLPALGGISGMLAIVNECQFSGIVV